jgi:hypothetical protein
MPRRARPPGRPTLTLRIRARAHDVVRCGAVRITESGSILACIDEASLRHVYIQPYMAVHVDPYADTATQKHPVDRVIPASSRQGPAVQGPRPG